MKRLLALSRKFTLLAVWPDSKTLLLLCSNGQLVS